MKHLLLYALFVYIGIGCCRDTALAPYTYAVAETCLLYTSDAAEEL